MTTTNTNNDAARDAGHTKLAALAALKEDGFICRDVTGSALQFTGSGRSIHCEDSEADAFATEAGAKRALADAEETQGTVETALATYVIECTYHENNGTDQTYENKQPSLDDAQAQFSDWQRFPESNLIAMKLVEIIGEDVNIIREWIR